MTLHTAWLPNIGKCQSTYNTNVREDYQELVKQASQKHPDIQELFNQEVYPHFE